MTFDEVGKIELELTSHCNAKCPNCVRTVFPENYDLDFISFDDIKRIFYNKDKCIKDKQFTLCGQLGDPLANKEIFEICEFLVKNQGKVLINTNASLRSTNLWKKLGELSADYKVENTPNSALKIWFCVDGYAKTNKIYRVNTDFDKIIENMEAFKDAGGEGEWVLIKFEHNINERQLAIDHAKKLGFKFIYREPSSTLRKHPLANKGHPNFDPSGVICKHKVDREVHVGYNQEVLPCCFVARRRYQFPSEILSKFADFEPNWNNLKYHSLDNILAHEYFQTILEQSWSRSHPKHILNCEYCDKTKYGFL